MNPYKVAFGKVKWRLTVSYLFVTLAAIFMLAWWGLVVGTIYLHQATPGRTSLEILQGQIIPTLEVIFPSALILLIPAALVSVYFGFLTARWVDVRLANLREATQAWRRGNFSVKVVDDAADEISAFGQELNGMAAELEGLMCARGELAALEVRYHLARELHDSVKQQITAASFQIGAAASLLDRNLAAARACLVEAEDLTHAAHQELNSIIFELHPVPFESNDLARALKEFTDAWARQNPIVVHLETQVDGSPDPVVQKIVYRFTQEALSNVARHSNATQVDITLRVDSGELVLSIQDNGCGFEPETVIQHGLGLRSMRERIDQAGGRLCLTSQPQQGTLLKATIPLQTNRGPVIPPRQCTNSTR